MKGLFAGIKKIAYHYPSWELSTQELCREFPSADAERLEAKVGIKRRFISSPDETALDLAEGAAKKLFSDPECSPCDVDTLIVCTQSPDYLLPNTASMLQARLGLSKDIATFDINQGCSGFIYTLAVAKGLLECNLASNVLIVHSDTFSKFLNPADLASRAVFGDAAAAILVQLATGPRPKLDNFIFGTDGSGANHLWYPNSASRVSLEDGTHLIMDGPSVFNFTNKVVPELVSKLLIDSGNSIDDYDLIIPHQANEFMLESLRRKLRVDRERWYVDLAEGGNTVSCSIPIALAKAAQRGLIQDDSKVLVVGFGVGLSWGGCTVTL